MPFKNLVALMLSIGVIQVALYYVIGATIRLDAGFAIPQTDTLLYCQAARRIAEGAPFSFSAGASVSTGTTGVLYPFLLAIPYALGCVGDNLLFAGFWLNACFYLAFLGAWAVVVNAKIKDPFARLVASVLIATFGQTAYSAFAQSDMGLLLLWSSLFVAGLSIGSRYLYGTMLIVFPLVRPEGSICVIAFLIVLICRFVFKCEKEELHGIAADIVIAVLSVISVIGVFAFNWLLTGKMGFSSLAHKGYFSTMSFPLAIFSSAADFMKMSKALLLGIPDGMPRDFLFLPVIGAVAMWCGVFLRNWRRSSNWREFVWLLAVFGGLATVAQSGWQNTNIDRYLGWMLPTVLIFSAGGVGLISRKMQSVAIARMLGWMLMLFSIGMSVVHLAIFQFTSRDADVLREFAIECEKVLPKGESLGCWGDCGVAYEMSPRKVCHLPGIYSMEFLTKETPLSSFEILKNEADKRFDNWFCKVEWSRDLGLDLSTTVGKQILVGPSGYSLLKADWSSFDAAASLPAVAGVKGMALKSRVDVGYEREEIAADYRVDMKYNINAFVPFVLHDNLDGQKVTEVARLVLGMDSMNVDLETGKDVLVVMRTYPERSMLVKGSSVKYAFSNPLKFNIAIDGEISSTACVQYAEKGFSDVAFTIPGHYITKRRPRVSFLGDHIACCYWFYQ